MYSRLPPTLEKRDWRLKEKITIIICSYRVVSLQSCLLCFAYSFAQPEAATCTVNIKILIEESSPKELEAIFQRWEMDAARYHFFLFCFV